MKILLYEHVSGGGFAGDALPPSLLSEGFAMLRGLAADFKVARHEVTVLLDSRLADFSPPVAADHFVWVSELGSASQSIANVAESVDAVFVVAPEANQTLQKLVDQVEVSGQLSLNSKPTAIAKAADKASLLTRLNGLGLKAPKTVTFGLQDPLEIIELAIREEMDFPCVFKPLNGAGCSGTSIVRSEAEIGSAVDKINADPAGSIMVQEFIEGSPASVSLIAADSKALPVSLNLQDITLASPDEVSSYNGGLVPFDHPLKEAAFAAAKRIVESFGGLRGYVGVDVILGDGGVVVVEVNPRLTTSYVGLRRVADFNVAESILGSSYKGVLPEVTHPIGVSCFSKVPVSRPVVFAWQDFLRMEDLASPPFPMANEETCYGMLQSYGDTVQNALRNLGEAKKRLHEIWQRGLNPW